MWSSKKLDNTTTLHSLSAMRWGRVTDFKLLGVTVLEDLSWGTNTASVEEKGPTMPLLSEETEEFQNSQAANGEQLCY